MNLSQFAALFPGRRCQLPGDGSWKVCCPCHEDKDPTLHVSIDASGKLLLHCPICVLAGLKGPDFCRAIGYDGPLTLDEVDMPQPANDEQYESYADRIVSRERDQEKRALYAKQLGVSEESLRRLDYLWVKYISSRGQQQANNGFAIREVRSDGQIEEIGVQIRSSTGAKWVVTGSKTAAGLFLPVDHEKVLSSHEEIFVCEGVSDTAAAIDLGLPAIGRFNKLAGTRSLVNLLRRFPSVKRVILVQDNDGGVEDTQKVAKIVATRWKGEVEIAEVPEEAKDIREWVVLRGGSPEAVGSSLTRRRVEGAAEPPGGVEVAQAAPVGRQGEIEDLPDLGTQGDWAIAMHEWFKGKVHHTDDRWHTWDGTRWVMDSDPAAVVAWMQKVHRRLDAEARRRDDEDEAKMLRRWANVPFSASGAKGVVELLRMQEGIRRDNKDWDTRPHLLQCLNGVVDLSTGILTPVRPDDYLRLCVPHEYDPDATCPRFERFLEECTDGNEEMLRSIRLALGYCVTGENTERALFYLMGPNGGGKSKLVQLLGIVLGHLDDAELPGYVLDVPSNTFEAEVRNKKGEMDPALIDMRLKPRIVTGSEVGQKTKLHDTTLKSISGADRQSKRTLFKGMVGFQPISKLFFMSNHPPHGIGLDETLLSRFRMLEFPVQFKGEREDKGLLDKLSAEAPGVLAWMVRAAMEFYVVGGLGRCQRSEQMLAEVRDSEPIVDFAESCLSPAGATDFMPQDELWELKTEYEKLKDVKVAWRVRDLYEGLRQLPDILPDFEKAVRRHRVDGVQKRGVYGVKRNLSWTGTAAEKEDRW